MSAAAPLDPVRMLAWVGLPALAIAVSALPRPLPTPAAPLPAADLDLPPPLAIEVRISPVGFEVAGPHALLSGTGAGAVVLPCAELPCALDGYDHAGLAALLRDVKVATPAAEVVVRPSATTPYRAVLDTVATAREDRGGTLFPFVTVAAP